MKKILDWLLALLLTAALPASAAERFEVTDGVYVALPDVFVAYTRDSVQDKQSDFLGVDVSLLTELMDEVGYCCALLHGTHFSQCFFSVTASIFQDFADMPQERLDAEYDALREEMERTGYIAEPHTLTADGGVRWLAMRLYPRAGYEEPLSVGVLYVTVEEGRQVVVSVVFPRESIPAGELETYDRMVAGMTIERASGGALPIIAVAVIALILLGAGVIAARTLRRRKNGPDSLPPEAYL